MATTARVLLVRTATRISARAAFSTAPRLAAQQTKNQVPVTPQQPDPNRKAFDDFWILYLGGGAAISFFAAPVFKNKKEEDVKKSGYKDYQAVYDEIATRLRDRDDYEDGSYGPVLLRLAWQASGTYDRATGTGGSNGATMRFAPEAGHAANKGLQHAREFLHPVKAKFPWISYADLWILGGVCAVQEMKGPVVPFRPGRKDKIVDYSPPEGRLPDAAKGQDHIRAVFHRMGFHDQEIVALMGAHAVGRCHVEASGYDGPWTFSPTVITNDYYKFLANSKWEWKKWDGPKQYVDSDYKSLMMLPADMALVKDKKFKEWVDEYAVDEELWFQHFSAALVKLFELGMPAHGVFNEHLFFKTLK